MLMNINEFLCPLQIQLWENNNNNDNKKAA